MLYEDKFGRLISLEELNMLSCIEIEDLEIHGVHSKSTGFKSNKEFRGY